MKKLIRQRISIAIVVLLVAVSIAASSVCGAAAVTYDLNPGTMGLEVDGTGRIWVSQYNADLVMGFLEGSVLASQNVLVVPKCENPREVNLGALGTKGYAASWDRYHDGNVVVFDIANGDIDAVLTEGPSSDCHFNVGLAPDESWLYFGNYYGGSVTKLSLPDGAHVATTSVGSWVAMVCPTPDGTHLYVIHNHASGAGNGLRVIDTATDPPVFNMTLPNAAHDMEFTPDGDRLYMTAPGSSPSPSGTPYVYVLDTSVPWAPVIADTIDVGCAPHTIALCDSVASVGLLDGRVCFVNIRCEDHNVIGYEQVAEPTVTEATIHGGDIHDGKAYFAGFTEGSSVHIVDLPPCGIVMPHEEDFEVDPEWLTNNPDRFFVNAGTLVGIGVTDANEYYTTPVSAHPSGMLLEWDSFLVSSDWSGALGFGLYDCSRNVDPLEADQLLRVAYGHNDGGYMVLLHAEDAAGNVGGVEMDVDLRGKWVHNVLTYDANAQVVAYSVAEDGLTLASAELPGIEGFTDVLCQLGFSLVHDCAVGGQTTVVRVDNVVYREWGSWASGVDDPVEESSYGGIGNYPNPFNPSTEIAFAIPVSGSATVLVHDAAGRLVRELVNAELEAGTHRVVWDGTDADGKSVASGVYFYSVRAPQVEERRKMVMLK